MCSQSAVWILHRLVINFLSDPGCSQSIIHIKMINLSTEGGGGGGDGTPLDKPYQHVHPQSVWFLSRLK